MHCALFYMQMLISLLMTAKLHKPRDDAKPIIGAYCPTQMIKSSSSYHQRTGETLSEAPSVCRPDCILHLPCAGVFFVYTKYLAPQKITKRLKIKQVLASTFTKPLTEPASNIGIAEDNECNNENVFTKIFGVKPNNHNKNKR